MKAYIIIDKKEAEGRQVNLIVLPTSIEEADIAEKSGKEVLRLYGV